MSEAACLFMGKSKHQIVETPRVRVPPYHWNAHRNSLPTTTNLLPAFLPELSHPPNNFLKDLVRGFPNAIALPRSIRRRIPGGSWQADGSLGFKVSPRPSSIGLSLEPRRKPLRKKMLSPQFERRVSLLKTPSASPLTAGTGCLLDKRFLGLSNGGLPGHPLF